MGRFRDSDTGLDRITGSNNFFWYDIVWLNASVVIGNYEALLLDALVA